MAIEKKTIKGVVRARCPKCGKWSTYDSDNWYFREGEAESYLGHDKACERERSAEWHRQKRLKARKPAPKKS